jgi:hypothetical protein
MPGDCRMYVSVYRYIGKEECGIRITGGGGLSQDDTETLIKWLKIAKVTAKRLDNLLKTPEDFGRPIGANAKAVWFADEKEQGHE